MTGDPIRRARKHEAAGELDAALAAYREVGPEAAEFAEARIRIVGLLLLRGGPEEAEREARAFIASRPDAPQPHATLGQVLRLAFRHDEAIAAFRRAVELAPREPGFRALLNDARRGRYWAPDAGLYEGLRAHVASGQAGPGARYRLLHLQFLGLLNPDVQRWLTATAGEDLLPETLRRSLDERFGGRFSTALGAVLASLKDVRATGSPYAPARARVALSDGSAREGTVEDSDGTVGGALEAIDRDEYALLPFGGLASVEFGAPAGAYVAARVQARGGGARDVEVPALYFFTEGCRPRELREGRLTVWRTFTGELRVGLGLRDFALSSGTERTLVGLDRVKRIEFVSP